MTKSEQIPAPQRYTEIEDFTQMKCGDILEYRCPRFGLVTQWRVDGIYLGGLGRESLIALKSITNRPASNCNTMMVPEQMTRMLPIIRPSAEKTETRNDQQDGETS